MGEMIRAISLWQPWASLWASGRKVHETRHWSTDYRGPLVIHAAQRFERDVPQLLDDILTDEFGPHWGLELPRGGIVGRCNLIACLPTMDDSGRLCSDGDDLICGNFAPGRFAWRGADFEMFKESIPYKGRQGFFAVSASILPARPEKETDR